MRADRRRNARPLPRSRLGRELTMMSAWSTGSALLLVFCAAALSALLGAQDGQRARLSALAATLGSDGTAALQAGSRLQAARLLGRLAARDGVSAAVLYDRDGAPLAQWGSVADSLADSAAVSMADSAGVAGAAPADGAAQEAAPASPAPLAPATLLALSAGAAEASLAPALDGGPWWAPGARLYCPLYRQQALLGVLMLEADSAPLWRAWLGHVGVVGAACLAGFGLALLLTGRVKGLVTDPIARLIEAAQAVASSQSYTHLVAHRRSDELGTLIDSFNQMLAQLESRDATLAGSREQLERQVGLRTEQLEKAKNAAEAASQAKSAFLATMSHEIRTPMNGVLGMTELLLASPLSAQQRHYTSMVKRSGEHLLVIINDILDFSKIEAGKLSVEYIHFNFRELLDDIDYAFAPQAQAKGLGLEFAIDHDIPVAIVGDPNRLRQVIVNLLGNAIKFTDRGQITFKVMVSSEDQVAVGLRFEVHDTGIGIAREAQERIFESFSQADGSTTRKHGGTGLGLTISKQLVELMGGQIGVGNALSQGSVFWFTVNFDKRRLAVDDAERGSPLPATTPELRALIVDDNPASRDVLERQLASWGLAGHGVASATEALQALQAAQARGQPYQVALLEMELPRTSGLALAATIKAAPELADVRLLLLSSERCAADTVQRRAAGVAFQLIKPVRDSDLYDCIVTPLRASAGTRLAAPAPAVPRAPGPRQPRRVLLAEDNPVNVEVALAMLDGLGVEVVSVRDGAQALQAAAEEDFDLILMDCQMPVMDGFAATAEIRRHELQRGRARALPIIAITANALQGDREACLAAGMDDYLSKPYTQHDLGAAMARWITLPRVPAPAAPVSEQRVAERRLALLPGAMPALTEGQGDAHADGLSEVGTDRYTDRLDETLADRPGRPPAPASRPALQGQARPPAPLAAPDMPARASPALPAAGSAGPPRQDGINHHALDNIRALSASGGKALLQRVIHAYVDDTPSHFRSLHQAIAALDAGTLRRAAHSLKSSSANVGAEALAHMCKQLETLGRNDSTEGAAGMVSEMEQEFQAVRHSLSAILEKET